MKPRIGPAHILTFLTLLLAVLAAAAGLFIPGLYRDTAEGIRQARATDLVTLAVAAPLLALGLWRAFAGSMSGRLVVIGTLGYMAYSYAIYAFSVVINPLTPVHIAILGTASWALLLSVSSLDLAAFANGGHIRLPRRAAGSLLLVVAALFGLLWLGQIMGAIVSGTLPVSVSALGLPTSPVFVLDLAFAIPLMALAGWWLLRHDRRGAPAVLAALSFLALLGLSVLSIFAIDAASGVSIEAPPTLIFGVVTALSAAFAFRAVLPGQTATSASLASHA